MTELSRRHFVDERGYTVCRCGYVFNEFSTDAEYATTSYVYEPDHYARLTRERAGFLPRTYARSGRLDAAVLGKIGQVTTLKDAKLIRDADVFASFIELRGDLKQAFMAAVEAYYAAPPVRGPRPLREAVFVCVAESLNAQRVWGHFDFDKCAAAFRLSEAQIRLARKSVRPWFDNYWKGDKRQ